MLCYRNAEKTIFVSRVKYTFVRTRDCKSCSSATYLRDVNSIETFFLFRSRAKFPLRCETAQYHQTICAVKSRSRALATFYIYKEKIIKRFWSYHIAFLSHETLHWLSCLHGCVIASFQRVIADLPFFKSFQSLVV